MIEDHASCNQRPSSLTIRLAETSSRSSRPLLISTIVRLTPFDRYTRPILRGENETERALKCTFGVLFGCSCCREEDAPDGDARVPLALAEDDDDKSFITSLNGLPDFEEAPEHTIAFPPGDETETNPACTP